MTGEVADQECNWPKILAETLTDEMRLNLFMPFFCRTTVEALVSHYHGFDSCMIAAKRALSSSLENVGVPSGLWTLLKPEKYSKSPVERRRTKRGGVIHINMITKWS